MPSASVLFYGRRSRSSRSFDDITSSSSSDSNPNTTSIDNFRPHRLHHHRRRISFDDPHRRHRHAFIDDDDHNRPPPHSPRPSFLSPIQESDLQQRQWDAESSSREIDNRETVRDVSRRFSRNNRLPGPVLLAKERLLQRLRSVSISAARQNRETSPSFHCNDFWVVDADWETNGFREPTTADTILVNPLQESTSEEPKKKPVGLSMETLSQLHHEIFVEHQNVDTNSMSKSSNECSICLENFVEDNELVSLPCGHRFHTLCLYPWLQTCGDCPYCRSCIMLASS